MAIERQTVTRTQLRRAATGCYCNGARQAARAMTQVYDAALAPSGLGVNQFSLLSALAIQGPVALGQLAEAIVMDRTTLTRNLRPLEKAGFVESVAGNDRRTRELRISDEGRARLAEAMPYWEEAHADMERRLGLGPETAQGTLRVLQHAAAAARSAAD